MFRVIVAEAGAANANLLGLLLKEHFATTIVQSVEQAWAEYEATPAPVVILDTSLLGCSDLIGRVRSHPMGARSALIGHGAATSGLDAVLPRPVSATIIEQVNAYGARVGGDWPAVGVDAPVTPTAPALRAQPGVELLAHREQLSTWLTDMPGMLVIWHSTNGHRDVEVVFVSDSIVDVLGITPTDAYHNQNFFTERVCPADFPAYAEAISALVSSGVRTDVTLRVGLETPRWISLKAHREVLPNGDHLYKVVLLDIDREKRAEEALATALDEARLAEQTQKRFLASISHELRTPLQAILGVAEVMEHGARAPEHTASVQAIQRAGHALRVLLDDLLDLTHLDAGQFRLASSPFAPRSLCESLRVLFAPQAAAAGIAFEVAANIDPAQCLLGDERRLAQIVFNLLSNALKFTPAGGAVQLAATLSVDGERGWLEVVVRDDGVGIDPADRSRIFDRFWRGKSAGLAPGGCGLGLAICHELLERMGGSIAVESAPGGGSSFHVALDLPVAARRDPEPRATPIAAAMRVVLVEDHPINRQVIAAMLGQLGVMPLVAADGETALRLVAEAPPDLILLDCELPDIDGIELCQRLRALHPGHAIPIVAQSAHVDTPYMERAQEAGLNDFLAKPFTLDQLAQVLRRRHPTTPRPTLVDALPALQRAQLVTAFRAELTQTLPMMWGHLTTGDFAAMHRLAHQSSGVSSMLGLVRLSHAFQSLLRVAVPTATLLDLIESARSAELPEPAVP